MKKLAVLLSLSAILLAGCTSNDLSREQALDILQKEAQYPKVVDYDVHCGDPAHARKVLEKGLEESGLLHVQRTQKLKDLGKPLISFTPKAEPYLLATPEKDRQYHIQKVKLADEELVEVTGIKTENDGKSAVVEYTTAYKNISPFSPLSPVPINGKETHNAYFSLYDDGWRLEKH